VVLNYVQICKCADVQMDKILKKDLRFGSKAASAKSGENNGGPVRLQGIAIFA
jgi:hypothetical protein